MKISLIALGQKMPDWVNQASAEFIKRLQEQFSLKLIEIPLQKRGKNQDLARIMEKELAAVSAAIPSQARLIALDLGGSDFSSLEMAERLTELEQHHSHLCFLIGGPEGHSAELLKRCQERWSLSKLTLPHPLVRIVFLEALYRAYCIQNNHPYHK